MLALYRRLRFSGGGGLSPWFSRHSCKISPKCLAGRLQQEEAAAAATAMDAVTVAVAAVTAMGTVTMTAAAVMRQLQTKKTPDVAS